MCWVCRKIKYFLHSFHITFLPFLPLPRPRSGLQLVCVLFSRMILNKDRKLFLPPPPTPPPDLNCSLFYFPGWYWTRSESCSFLYPPDLVYSLCVFYLFSRMILNKKDWKLFLPLPPSPWSGLQFVLFPRMILNKKDRKLFLPLPPLIWSAACVCSIFQDDIEQEGQKAVPSVAPHPTPQSGLQPVFYFPGWYWTRRTESCSFRCTPPHPPIWSAACVLFSRMILNKKDRKLKKGSGFHLDQFIMGILAFVCALFGLPWMCAATVRTIAHVSALSVMSRTHAPGEKPKLLGVIEQRVTNIAVSLLIGGCKPTWATSRPAKFKFHYVAPQFSNMSFFSAY